MTSAYPKSSNWMNWSPSGAMASSITSRTRTVRSLRQKRPLPPNSTLTESHPSSVPLVTEPVILLEEFQLYTKPNCGMVDCACALVVDTRSHLRCTPEHHPHPHCSAKACDAQSMSHHEDEDDSEKSWHRRGRRRSDDKQRERRTAPSRHTFPTFSSLTSYLLLSLVLVALVAVPSTARHYIAPGPCTWTHVSPFTSSSRDSRLKSSVASSSSLLGSSHHHHYAHASALSSGLALNADLMSGALPSDFDVALRCSVAHLTPVTLNLSVIEPEHTVRLAIGCYSDVERSSLRSDPRTPHQAPFEHLRALQALTLDACKLDSLPSATFRGLLSLKNLTIRNAVPVGRLQTTEPFLVEPDSFTTVASHLEHLDLSANGMSALPADLFCPFATLQSLNLSRNSLHDLASFGLIDPATGRLCLQELHTLDLSANSLEFVPETSGVAALRALHYLNLSSNGIAEIAELAFSALTQLTVLDLSGNRLRTLPVRLLRDSEKLRELSLANNGLSEIPDHLLKSLTNLQTFDLSGNKLHSDSFTEQTFPNLIRVVIFDLSRNRIRRIDKAAFSNLYSVQMLSLEDNELETIEQGAFGNLFNLHTLKLGGNRFRHLPDLVLSGALVLNRLSLANNQLEHIHEDAFKNCSNVQHLDFSNNRLPTLPIAIRSLRSLRVLNFSSNKLVSLTEPGPLVHTPHLTSLDLSSNYLTNLSHHSLRPLADTLLSLRLDGNRLRALDKSTLEDLRTTLRHLRLDRNEFTDMAASLAAVKSLAKLESLNVSRNGLTWFDYSLLPASLRTLDLSHNRLESLRNLVELEGTSMRLETLDLSHNQLKEVTATSIPHSIRSLNLHSNALEKVAQFAFVAKHNVTFVDLRNNSLRRIDNNAFRLGVQRPTSSYFLNRPSEASDYDAKYLPPPIFLISGNPYICDCTIEWLQRVNQLVGGVTGSGAISTYPRVADLEEVTCQLPFTRQSAGIVSPATISTSVTLPKPKTVVPLLSANSSDFLCSYKTHCFTLCHCCEFDACDCEMMCPENCTCYQDQTWNTNIVDCSASTYRTVPARIPMDVTSLYLDGNQLYSLTAHTFIGRKNMRVLQLNNSAIESIANRSFNGLVFLEELHLEYNQLTALNGFEFETLNHLTSLHLEHNRIAFIHEKTFSGLRSLQLLRLDHNQLTSFGHWFSPVGLLGNALELSSGVGAHARYLSVSLSTNPWSCESCGSMALLYDTLRVVASQLHITDSYEVRCLQPNASTVNLLRSLGEIEGSILGRCNLSATSLPVAGPTTTTTLPYQPAIIGGYESILPQVPPFGGSNSFNGGNYAPPKPDEGLEPSEAGRGPSKHGEDEPPIHYRPIDQLHNRINTEPPEPSDLHDLEMDAMPKQSEASSSYFGGEAFGANLALLLLSLCCLLVVVSLSFAGYRYKQDIQLWFYGHYGVRLFESGGLCGCRAGGPSSRGRRGHGFTDTYVRDSEKLFDGFVIYARPDESFVTQQLAAELECGYPPYRLCLRYRDLPAPAISTSSASENGGSPSAPTVNSKDHGYAFEAVTHAIECSRRTVVVISESFLASDWCKFELKAAHQETLSSCKTHRLIAVIVPSATPATYHHAQQPVGKLAEALLARLDTETKACIRGVTVLTWGERRFWEKLRFSMPPSAATPVCSGEGAKGRTSTVVVTSSNAGYPSLTGPNSLSSSSSHRSSVLYDTSQPLYYGQSQQQHTYHYAQLPPQSGGGAPSLHKSSSLSIFGNGVKASPGGHPQQGTLIHPGAPGHTATLGGRNPFGSKPLPPPPNQPLPPVPLVNSHFVSPQQIHMSNGHMTQQQQAHAHAQASPIPPTYATCSEFGGEVYETTEMAHAHQQQQQFQQNIINLNSATLHGRSRAGLVAQPQFYHSARRPHM